MLIVDVIQTPHPPMRPILKPFQALGLVARQPRKSRLARHPDLLIDLRNRQAITNHSHHGLIPLLSRAQLPHPGSVKDQAKPL